MEYIKSFAVGTSGPVIFPHVYTVSRMDSYDYIFREYSLIAPTYFGLMSVLSTYISQTYSTSLRESLFITSIISLVFVSSLSYFVLSKTYDPYVKFSKEDWLKYFVGNGLLHLLAFNFTIYILMKNFNMYPVKIFVIGSSMFSYFITYLKVMDIDYRGKLNYNFKTFAVGEPFFQGLDLLFSLVVLNIFMGLTLQKSLSIWAVVGSLLWLVLAYTFKTYKYEGISWIYAFGRVLATGVVKAVVIYYLLKNLN